MEDKEACRMTQVAGVLQVEGLAKDIVQIVPAHLALVEDVQEHDVPNQDFQKEKKKRKESYSLFKLIKRNAKKKEKEKQWWW